jgi:hypothetical protein
VLSRWNLAADYYGIKPPPYQGLGILEIYETTKLMLHTALYVVVVRERDTAYLLKMIAERLGLEWARMC